MQADGGDGVGFDEGEEGLSRAGEARVGHEERPVRIEYFGVILQSFGDQNRYSE